MIYIFNKEKLEYEVPSKTLILKWVLAILFLVLNLSYFVSTLIYKDIITSEEARVIVLREDNDFSRKKLKEYILQLNIKFPDIVMAQAELESMHFKSPIFKENHNFFGMKQAFKRPTTNKGENRGHAYFDSWRDCVLDYAFYSATYLNDIKSEKEYLEYLKASYAEDPEYLQKVSFMVKKQRERELRIKDKNISKENVNLFGSINDNVYLWPITLKQ